MKFFTYGKTEHPKLLLIHPMFTSAEYFSDFIAEMQDKYFLIVPTLDGHYENSVFKSTLEEERQIDEFLLENNISELRAVIGFSLGGNIAYDYFCRHSGQIKMAIIDSAPLFNFSKILKRIYFNQYLKRLKNIKNGCPDVARELNKSFNGMGEYQKNIAPLVSEQSLRGLVESCFSIKTYGLNEEEQRRITFIYGTKDIAGLCLTRIKKYPRAKIVKLKGYNHCGYFNTQLKKYILDFIV